MLVAVSQIFDRVKSVALWSAKKKRIIKGYGSAAIKVIKYKTNKKYHTVGTFPQSNGKIVERVKIDTTNKQLHDLVQAFHLKVAELNYFYVTQISPCSEMIGHARAFHVCVKCQPTCITGRTALLS